MSATIQISRITDVRNSAESEILTPEAAEFLRVWTGDSDLAGSICCASASSAKLKYDLASCRAFQERHYGIRKAEWTVAPIPTDLLDRRVEITGPPERKMVINALNSGANVFMADFEDSNAPTWSNCLEGQRNLRDANWRTIEYSSPEGKLYPGRKTRSTLCSSARLAHG